MVRASAPPRSWSGRCFRCNGEGHLLRDCDATEKICYKCDQGGHLVAECQNERVEKARVCYRCRRAGHLKEDCPEAPKKATSTPAPAVDASPKKKEKAKEGRAKHNPTIKEETGEKATKASKEEGGGDAAGRKEREAREKRMRCFRCGLKGHRAAACEAAEAAAKACFRCSSTAHLARDCDQERRRTSESADDSAED